MSNNTSQRGSIVLVIVVVVLLVGALGFVGWRMLARQNAEGQASKTSAEVILTQDDLDAATKSLDELDFGDESADAAELQANL